MKLDNIHVLGMNSGPSGVTVNGQKASFKYNADTKVSHTGSVLVTDWELVRSWTGGCEGRVRGRSGILTREVATLPSYDLSLPLAPSVSVPLLSTLLPFLTFSSREAVPLNWTVLAYLQCIEDFGGNVLGPHVLYMSTSLLYVHICPGHVAYSGLVHIM